MDLRPTHLPCLRKRHVQGIALNGAFFFFLGTGRFCCVHRFGSGAILQHLVPERILLTKAAKKHVLG